MGEIFSFGVWVRRRRKALDLTQDALARRAGCAVSMIRKIEADERKPSRQIATLLASALEIPAAEREQFLQAARAELAVDKLAAPPLPSAPEAPPSTLPTGTVTFLFTDIAGSTRLWEQHTTAMQPALARHDHILRDAITTHGGMLVKGTGDGLHAAFVRATYGVHAALAAQRALTVEDWGAIGLPRGQSLRVRMALHIGVAEERNGDYFGPAVNRTARLLAVGHGGQILLSHAMCDVVRDHLPPGATLRDLGAHRLKDLSREEQIWQLTVPDLPADFPPLTSLSARRHNLPIQQTSFVGRENQLAVITRLLDGTHLLTLTGPGGTGKTRLSLQFASELLADAGRFADGVWLVELAPLADPALVPQAAASALDLREDAGRPLLATLTDFLRGKDLLLIVDNCEHVVEACAQLAETLLRACPQVRILASSREALGIAGEVAWRVPPLAVPPTELRTANDASDHVGALAQYESIRLFAERAAAVLPGFTVTNGNARALAQVCARLDGIPLAIELAAARVNVLRVEQIAARLDDRFRLLTGGSRNAVPRQQTLRALIDWSYDLLSEAEQALLRRLAVFAGGWTLEAAEAVCTGGSLNQDDVLDVLTQLVKKSLVVADREQGQETRYRLLETIRQYALERLNESGEAEEQLRRHAANFLALAERDAPYGAWDDRAAIWCERLAADIDNLRAALAWSHPAAERAEIAVRLVGALGLFWSEEQATLIEAWGWVEWALEQSHTTSILARAKILWAAGNVAHVEGDNTRAMAFGEQALILSRQIGDHVMVASLLLSIANTARNLGNLEQSQAAADEALGLFRQTRTAWGVGAALVALGDIAFDQGNNALATALFEEALALARQHRSPQVASSALITLARVARVEGNYARAMALYQESLTSRLERKRHVLYYMALYEMGKVALDQGDHGQAAALFQQCITDYKEVKGLTFSCLEGLAAVAVAQGDGERAARLWGAAEVMRQSTSLPMDSLDVRDYERWISAACARLEGASFAAAWAAGRQLTLEQAVAEALAE
jgi:predicted ATPase/class 3 adenylate cyclase